MPKFEVGDRVYYRFNAAHRAEDKSDTATVVGIDVERSFILLRWDFVAPEMLPSGYRCVNTNKEEWGAWESDIQKLDEFADWVNKVRRNHAARQSVTRKRKSIKLSAEKERPQDAASRRSRAKRK